MRRESRDAVFAGGMLASLVVGIFAPPVGAALAAAWGIACALDDELADDNNS